MSDWHESKKSQVQSESLDSAQGKPLISSGGPNARYQGRVVIEVWDQPDPSRPPFEGLAYTYDRGALTTIGPLELLQRVADGFPVRFKRDRDKMSDH